MRFTSLALATGIGAALTLPLAAQQPAAAPPPDPTPLALGVVAPDFALPGSTRFGVVKNLIHLSDFKGKTVVLAFFFKARTHG
ncbi:MAG TPA: hypothetical protein VF923_08915 [Gemmatimonadales bacterium]